MPEIQSPSSPVLESTITCPACGTASREIMPTDACLYFYECTGCRTLLKPKPGDCCVFCSYGSVPCPPIQQCCGGDAPGSAGASWSFCSLSRDAFADRMTEIDGLVTRFDGRAQATDEGVDLIFAARDGVRLALDTLIAKERQCCGTLTFTVEESDERTSLRISAPETDRHAVQTLVAHFRSINAAGSAVSLSAELRPGVLRPDWSSISLPGARRTLQRRLDAQPDGVARWAGRDHEHDRVWQAILGLFRDHGGAPDATAIAQAAGRSLEETQYALQALQARDLVVLDAAAAVVVAAYPFASDRTGHQVTIGRRTVNALCAIDALGVGALCGIDTEIASSCAWCQAPIRIETCGNGRDLRSVTPADTVVWYTLVFDGRVAQSCCPSTVFLCCDEHMDRWASAGRSPGGGDRLAIAEAFEIGVALFGPLLRKAAAGTSGWR